MDENREELYNDIFSYRILLQDINENETYIIRELKIYLVNKRYNINEINNILYSFYQYFNIEIELSSIENIRLLLFNINNISNLVHYNRNIINNDQINNNDINNNEENNNEENNNQENNNEENNEINRNIIYNSYLYDIILNYIDFRYTNNYDNLEDVIVSLDTNELNNLKTYENDKKNINCCICMHDINEKELITELKCNHVFHENCIKTYLDNYSHKCPICRISAGNTKNNVI